MLFKKILRAITSRYFISLAFIGIELFLLFWLQSYLNDYLFAFYVLSYIISVLTLLFIINSKTIPETKMPWMIIILVFQPFGALLYIILGRRLITVKEKKFLKRLKQDRKNLFDVDDTVLDDLKDIDNEAYQKAKSLSHDSFNSLCDHTIGKYYKCGEDFFFQFIKELSNAKKYIFMEYFIVEEGYMWEEVLNILKEKVSEGVEVRFLYDDIGCLLTLPVNYFKHLRSYGIKANCFAKFNGRANSSHNNRSHRKITIIDGLIAYTGGINLADEYINKNDRLGYWKDSIIEIRGKGVNELIKTYLFDWDLNDGNISNIDAYLNNDVLLENDGYYLPFGTGPRPIYIPNIAGNTYLNLINQAKNYIYITTPYLIIDNELTNALINAAKRGVEVIIITPHIPDKKIVYALTKNSYTTLINNGVKIYEFKPGFIHAKNFICDDLYAVCGTINFDYRSLIHHYENAIWMYKTSVIKDMKQDFLETLDVSIIQTNETAYQNGITRLFVGILKVFSPFF